MALAGVIAGHHGSITVASGAPQYDDYTGELTKWEFTINSDRYDSTRFISSPAAASVPYRTVDKGMYIVRGTLTGFWDTSTVGAADATRYNKYAADRAAVAITFISRDGATDQGYVMNCKLNNYNMVVNTQSGLMTFSANFTSEGDITSAASYVA